AKLAAIDGYTVAGKTGTARKTVEGTYGYKAGAYYSSFAGFVPSQHHAATARGRHRRPAGHGRGCTVGGRARPAGLDDGTQPHHPHVVPFHVLVERPTSHRPDNATCQETVGSSPVRLDELLDGVDVLELKGDAAVDVRSLTHDSAQVTPGTLFCCVPGRHADGHDFADQAVAGGAVALLVERVLPLDVTQVRVAEVRAAMGPVAAALYGHPSRWLTVVGVTGTNGKTTTTHFLRGIFEANGWHAGTIGTLDGARTTPEAPVLQATLASMRDGGQRAAAVEVSSHALTQRRVDAVHFAAVVFTNLSQDHLDYHGTMEEYFAAKATLFDPARADVAVVNADDPYGRRLIEHPALRTVPYSRTDAVDVQSNADSARFRWRGVDIELSIGGAFNVDNAVAAATTAAELGIDVHVIGRG